MLPTAPLPRCGVTWAVVGDHHITSLHELGGVALDLRLTIDANGLVVAVELRRRGDPDRTGTWDRHPFELRAGGGRV
jgi:hypothetical protein